MYDLNKDKCAIDTLIAHTDIQVETLTEIYNDIKVNGVSKSIMVSVESIAPNTVSEYYPLNSYTENITAINKTVAMEGILRSIFNAIKSVIIAIYDFIIKGLKWLLSLFRGQLKKDTEHQADALTLVLKLIDRYKLDLSPSMYNAKSKNLLINFVEDNYSDMPLSSAVKGCFASTYADIDMLVNILRSSFDAINKPSTIDSVLDYNNFKEIANKSIVELWDGEKITTLYDGLNRYADKVRLPISLSMKKAYKANEIKISLNTPSYSMATMETRLKIAKDMFNAEGLKRALTKDEILAIFKSAALSLEDDLIIQEYLTDIVNGQLENITKARKDADRMLMSMTNGEDLEQQKFSTFIKETATYLGRFHTVLTSSSDLVVLMSRTKAQMVNIFATSMVKI